jgi:filamentous hemagglutinin family protein
MPNLRRQLNNQPLKADDSSIVKGKITRIERLNQAFAQNLGFGLGLIGISCAACFGNNAQAQITPDRSVPFSLTPDTINGAAATRINGGIQQGSNLFHSFSQFNVNQGQQVYFSDPGVSNILSRVTGNEASIILGKLGVDGAANLFLLNPKGIIFGPNSSLDVRGSFVGTTANAIEFGTQGLFSATPTALPILTVNPSALLFNQIAAASITNQSTAGLQVPEGRTLSLIGGDVRLEGGRLRAPGGRIELGGLAEAGRIAIDGDNLKLTFPDHLSRGDVTLTNGSIVDVVAGGAGDIFINARNIEISGAETKVCAGIGASGSSCNSPDSGLGSANSQAGNIVLNGTGTVSIKQSRIENNLNPGATGNSGDIFDAIINRDKIFGSILITGDAVALGDKASVSTSSFGTGSAGIVFITTKGNLSVENSGIFSNMSSTQKGNAGGILLEGGSISLNNSQLRVQSDSTNGESGIVFLDAQGGSISANSSVISSDIRAGAVGNARGVKFQAGSVSLTDTSVSSSTYGTGNAGDLIVTADNSVKLVRSYVFNNVESGGVGQGGGILVTARTLSLLKGSQLQTIVRGADGDIPAGVGNAGGILIEVRDAEISGINDNPADNNVGKPSLITSSSFGQGNAGLVVVLADRDVSVVGKGSAISSDILAGGVGDAGGVGIVARTLFIKDGARVSVNNLNPQSGEAGAILIDVRDLRLENQGFLGAVTLSGNGGDLILTVKDLLVLTKGSEISTTAGIAPGGGNGGNVSINTQYVFAVPVNDSNISAQAYLGNGGNINLDAFKLYRIGPNTADFIDTNDITVSSRYGRTGEYRGNVLDTDPTQGLTNLPVNALDPSRLIAQRCAVRSRASPNQENKFTVTQRGGLPPNPNEMLQNESVVTNWVTLDAAGAKLTANVPAMPMSKSTQYIEAQGWVIDEKGEVVLTAQALRATPHNPTLTPIFSCNGS